MEGNAPAPGRPFGGADTLSTSYTIVKAAEMKGSFDLIFCGKETMDGAEVRSLLGLDEPASSEEAS